MTECRFPGLRPLSTTSALDRLLPDREQDRASRPVPSCCPLARGPGPSSEGVSPHTGQFLPLPSVRDSLWKRAFSLAWSPGVRQGCFCFSSCRAPPPPPPPLPPAAHPPPSLHPCPLTSLHPHPPSPGPCCPNTSTSVGRGWDLKRKGLRSWESRFRGPVWPRGQEVAEAGGAWAADWEPGPSSFM